MQRLDHSPMPEAEQTAWLEAQFLSVYPKHVKFSADLAISGRPLAGIVKIENSKISAFGSGELIIPVIKKNFGTNPADENQIEAAMAQINKSIFPVKGDPWEALGRKCGDVLGGFNLNLSAAFNDTGTVLKTIMIQRPLSGNSMDQQNFDIQRGLAGLYDFLRALQIAYPELQVWPRPAAPLLNASST